ncbi:MAG: phage holin family protein [Rhodoferax sp.]|uniref:phage holin family protein n=1 Tax=Rhodoferax sp. TaxID=50421 RepID=UPI0013FE6D89|nr:phage holin family protein [Rhodoferax sp.]NDP38048.1 phage holin family protein [Rhodoferax sp.]
MSNTGKSSGLFASVRRLLGTVLEIAQVRLELLGTELELEKRRLFDALLFGLIALLAVGVGVVLLCGFIILLFWEGYRLPAVGVLTLLFFAAGAWLAFAARKRLQSATGIFEASLAELKLDRAGLQTSGSHEQR